MKTKPAPNTVKKPIGKPDRFAVVYGWRAFLLHCDGETILHEWRWDTDWQEWVDVTIN